MGIHFLLLETVQIVLTSGVGGVFILNYATKGLFLKDNEPWVDAHGFASDYQELMWLAERQKQHLSEEEMHRFYQLRDNWPKMHSQIPGR